MGRVAVRIVKRAGKFHVIGRSTTVVCETFEQAWAASVPYFAGRTR